MSRRKRTIAGQSGLWELTGGRPNMHPMTAAEREANRVPPREDPPPQPNSRIVRMREIERELSDPSAGRALYDAIRHTLSSLPLTPRKRALLLEYLSLEAAEVAAEMLRRCDEEGR
jgi:hypothetical protein